MPKLTYRLDEMPASTGDQLTSDLYNIATPDGLELGCGTADEIRQMMSDQILPPDIVMTLIWTKNFVA